jgi:hypothetical protein
MPRIALFHAGRFTSGLKTTGKSFAAKCMPMTSLLISVFHILLVLAAISLFVCTIPLWLVVVVVFLVLR